MPTTPRGVAGLKLSVKQCTEIVQLGQYEKILYKLVQLLVVA